MSFKNRNMSVIAYANGFTLWHYVAESGETLQDITENQKYFTPMHSLVNVGDIIIINADGSAAFRTITEIKGSDSIKLDTLK